MPPIREHKSASPISQHRQNPSSSGEDDIENFSPKSDKPLSMVDKKRGKRSPSINTRASRVEYIDSKRKAASSLEQYLQHIVQAYNIVLWL
ncbi:hypothetical protein GLOIN_2v1770928 [Rhizophagus irregularis DAOM 181602=DAOM 197198]|uniref:Uncharacterized protein n=1 Tax=Rhizophagus irregularis (strain DAOM 181602 / DAOM 197198 / MUCL 43194) TaxID=747089 RepID=A0A2P4QB59_RHIID|nr:hypothetical protein GLOIN_2v1770928 [Rhizophagus irregularis DAOM 181602=DAOM 197198]POG74875.1 hypothetical protein GLOIN_2v1770928 [Rhizophagus irregularis DAOM 181602=DAOM 197198]CAG8718428.1 7350_t:CDS:2 [Rhizophagus irregularis]|eukprot:XP_025181741.1 hypothetical protein GLOIN_2v1770928 [Rhizophagus irregularis DAOM 181602=DAOM 197198]